MSLVALSPILETAIRAVLPSRPSSSTTLYLIKDICEPGSKKHLNTFEPPFDPHKIAATVCRITFPPIFPAMQLAITEDGIGGAEGDDCLQEHDCISEYCSLL